MSTQQSIVPIALAKAVAEKDYKSVSAELAPGVLIVKPQTFMNDSGTAVAEAVHFWKVDAARDLLIVHDEADVKLGEIREVQDSSSAGHNGVQSIIDQLGTKQFRRIRIGIESRESRSEKPTDAFVLEPFTADELKLLKESVFPKVAGMIRQFTGLPSV
jgi:PTH1 family peptidyl-tRNA hydrolase